MIKVVIILPRESDYPEFYFETLPEAHSFINICLKNDYAVEVSKTLERK